MKNFMEWFLSQDFGDTPKADLQRDVKRHKNPIKSIGTSYMHLKVDMYANGACNEALNALEEAYTQYKNTL